MEPLVWLVQASQSGWVPALHPVSADAWHSVALRYRETVAAQLPTSVLGLPILPRHTPQAKRLARVKAQPMPQFPDYEQRSHGRVVMRQGGAVADRHH